MTKQKGSDDQIISGFDETATRLILVEKIWRRRCFYITDKIRSKINFNRTETKAGL